MTIMAPIQRLVICSLLASHLLGLVKYGESATVPCETDDDCTASIAEKSECSDGFCTNPFHYGGCLETMLPEWTKKRVCNSNDPIEAEEMGHCRRSDFSDEHYMEIRILAQDWESSWVNTWILQILLSEILDVPTSTEDEAAVWELNFYDKESRLDVDPDGVAFDQQLIEGSKGDCRPMTTEAEGSYTSCAHVVPEIWSEDLGEDIEGAETLQENGALGINHLYVPRFTVDRDPSLVTYRGLSGKRNRKKLAGTFKRPTNWKQYCEEFSPTNCTSPDGTAERAPESEEEDWRMFAEGLYTGYFRNTPQNDCANNKECTGEIIDFACSWGSYMIPQLHHLDIALESSYEDDPVGGYNSGLAYDIWAAANATKTDVIMLWFTPDPLYDQFIGTDAEMTQVLLPPPTKECVRARETSIGSRCEDDVQNLVGDDKSACDYNSQFLKRATSETLREFTKGTDTPPALWSPAYDAIVNTKVSHLDLGEIFQIEQNQERPLGDFATREAVCRWFADNIDRMEKFIPPTYPRVMEPNVSTDWFFTIGQALGVVTLIVVLTCSGLAYLRRKTAMMYNLQPQFLFLLLLGMVAASIGAIAISLPPSSSSCPVVPWFTYVGSALQHVPLLFRIYSINNLVAKGKAMQRVRLKPKKLFFFTAVTLAVLTAVLTAWMTLDSPEPKVAFITTNRLNESGDTIVVHNETCGSESLAWVSGLVGWQVALLGVTAMIAVIARTIKEDMNDTISLSRMIYANFFFLLVKIMIMITLKDDEQHWKIKGVLSLVYSTNVLVSIAIYVLPKFLYKSEAIKEESTPDLFLNTSVMVADVTGFSAWSSVREPVQVFTLLEQLFQHLDKVANKHNVFKVETVREQYVAATGIPEAQTDHAVVMAKFAMECLKTMKVVSQSLEVRYGPDTADLQLRIGIHSGPVTGGFTKGKGGRFQLFGDTMTTCAHFHAQSEANRIHMSQETADLLKNAGRKAWVQQRQDQIEPGPHGTNSTYWLVRRDRSKKRSMSETGDAASSALDSTNAEDIGNIDSLMDCEQRWVDFNVQVLQNLLKQVVAHRDPVHWSPGSQEFLPAILPAAILPNAIFSAAILPTTKESTIESESNAQEQSSGGIPLDEVSEIIELPDFDKRAEKRKRTADEIKLDPKVLDQLQQLVSSISAMYNDNPFHNFAHASYVVMAIQKYMNRIIAASDMHLQADRHRTSSMEALHKHTYGITSDALTQFACVFSALIHDIDHPGVPNPRLVLEDTLTAEIYQNRSVAEQKSFDLAWEALMQDEFSDLRKCICPTDSDLKRFRQLVINSVMATDLGDKELKELRNRRWQRAFDAPESRIQETARDAMNRKATIVVEHLIQAADVAHTCQHWNIYRKWNQRLFEECYQAFKAGRADTNPVDGWYQGELGFFDFYIIPLSEKLRDCGVFGLTSDENLNYARENRAKWEQEGRAIVEEMIEQMNSDMNTIEEEEDLVSDDSLHEGSTGGTEGEEDSDDDSSRFYYDNDDGQCYEA